MCININKDNCSLFFVSDKKISEHIIKDLINSEQRIRLCLDDNKLIKKNYYEVIGKLDVMYYLNNESTIEDITKNLDDFIQIKNGSYPKNIVFISKHIDELSKHTFQKEYTSEIKFMHRNIRIVQALREIRKKYPIGPDKIIFINLFESSDDMVSRIDHKKDMLNNLKRYFTYRTYISHLFEKLIKESGFDFRLIHVYRFLIDQEAQSINFKGENNKISEKSALSKQSTQFEQLTLSEQSELNQTNKLITVKNLNEIITSSLNKITHPFHKKEIIINNYQDYLYSKISNSFYSFIFWSNKSDDKDLELLLKDKPVFNLHNIHKPYNENNKVFCYNLYENSSDFNSKDDYFIPNNKINTNVIKFYFYTGMIFSMTAMLMKKLI